MRPSHFHMGRAAKIDRSEGATIQALLLLITSRIDRSVRIDRSIGAWCHKSGGSIDRSTRPIDRVERGAQRLTRRRCGVSRNRRERERAPPPAARSNKRAPALPRASRVAPGATTAAGRFDSDGGPWVGVASGSIGPCPNGLRLGRRWDSWIKGGGVEGGRRYPSSAAPLWPLPAHQPAGWIVIKKKLLARCVGCCLQELLLSEATRGRRVRLSLQAMSLLFPYCVVH